MYDWKMLKYMLDRLASTLFVAPWHY